MAKALRNANIVKGLIKLGYREGKEFYPDRDGDGLIVLSAENWDGKVNPPADYYGEFRGGYPWIDPKVEALVERNGGFIEWETAGSLKIFKN